MTISIHWNKSSGFVLAKNHRHILPAKHIYSYPFKRTYQNFQESVTPDQVPSLFYISPTQVTELFFNSTGILKRKRLRNYKVTKKDCISNFKQWEIVTVKIVMQSSKWKKWAKSLLNGPKRLICKYKWDRNISLSEVEAIERRWKILWSLLFLYIWSFLLFPLASSFSAPSMILLLYSLCVIFLFFWILAHCFLYFAYSWILSIYCIVPWIFLSAYQCFMNQYPFEI